MLTALFLSLSHAVTGKVCVKAATEYTDTNPASNFYDGLKNRPLRGVWVEVKENFGAGNVYFGRTGTTGGDKGCVSFLNLDGSFANTYKVRVTADQMVDGAEVNVYDSQNPTDRWRQVLATSVSFQGFPTGTVTVDYVVGPQSHWSILAVTGWALHRSTGGLGSAISTDFYTPGTPAPRHRARCSRDGVVSCIDGQMHIMDARGRWGTPCCRVATRANANYAPTRLWGIAPPGTPAPRHPGTNGVLSVPGTCAPSGCINGDAIYLTTFRAKKEHFIAYGLGLSFFEAMGGVALPRHSPSPT